MAKKNSRYNQIKKLPLNEMAVTLSYYFGCDRCPAKDGNCYDNCDMCIDAITKWLEQEGSL